MTILSVKWESTAQTVFVFNWVLYAFFISQISIGIENALALNKQQLSWDDLETMNNALAPGRSCYNMKLMGFELISGKVILNSSSEIYLRWMPQNPTGE